MTVTVITGFSLTFTNEVFTDIDITVSGQGAKVIPLADSITLVYTTNPGSITCSASTNGKTTTNDQIECYVVRGRHYKPLYWLSPVEQQPIAALLHKYKLLNKMDRNLVD